MRSFPAQCLILCLASTILPVSAAPGSTGQTTVSDWLSERNIAMVLDSESKFDQALVHYRNALKLLPPTSGNDIAEMKTQIAMDLLRTGRYIHAQAAIRELLILVKQLKAQHKLDANTALALRGLVEECDAKHGDGKGFTAENIKIWRSCAVLGMQVCEVALPELNTSTRAAAAARSFLAGQDLAGALNFMEHYVKGMAPGDPALSNMQLKMACIQKLLNKPEALVACRANIEKSNSPSRTAYMISESQTWATDYKGSVRTIDEAFSRLAKSKNFSKTDKLTLLEARLDNALDSGQWAVAETAAKQCLQIAPPDSKKLTTYRLDLISCLRHQNRNKEAELVQSQMPKTEFDFVIDDERSAIKEAEQRRAGSRK